MTAPLAFPTVPGPTRAATEAREPVRILLVDDRPENLLALEAILEPLGETLVRASSGEDALRCLLREDYAVILLDVQMPGMNGFECAELIKKRQRSRSIPIIFLTAISKEEEYVFRGYEVGAVDYMFKPFQPDILRSKVSVFVDLFRTRAQIQSQERLLGEAQRRELLLRHQAELHESEARLAEVVRSAMDAIVMFGEDRRVIVFNAAAEAMFGRPASSILMHPLDSLFPESLRSDALETMCSTRPDTPRLQSLVGLRQDGSEFPIETSVSCLTVGGARMFTLIARDVSERVEQERALREKTTSLEKTSAELQRANEELQRRQRDLERAMTARNRFYASMSHELRTPINAIIGYNTLLLDNIYGPLNEKQIQGLQRTHKAAKHLLELVNDVLDLSKIEAGKMELSIQPVVFPALLEDLFVTVRPMADEFGSTLELSHTGDSVTIATDPRRVRQIVLNLLSNAIKFGRGRPIRVTCQTRPDGGVQIEVIDQGIGIAAEDLPRIFDEFVQVSNPQQHSGGTGLGLPISSRLARLLDGSLEAESTIDVGSTFRLTLPVMLSDWEEPPSRDKERTVETPSAGKGPADVAANATGNGGNGSGHGDTRASAGATRSAATTAETASRSS